MRRKSEIDGHAFWILKERTRYHNEIKFIQMLLIWHNQYKSNKSIIMGLPLHSIGSQIGSAGNKVKDRCGFLCSCTQRYVCPSGHTKLSTGIFARTLSNVTVCPGLSRWTPSGPKFPWVTLVICWFPFPFIWSLRKMSRCHRLAPTMASCDVDTKLAENLAATVSWECSIAIASGGVRINCWAITVKPD